MSLSIAVLTTVHPAHDARILFKEASSLVRAGHSVTLFAQETEGAQDQADALGVRFEALRKVSRRADRPHIWRQLFLLLKAHAGVFDVWHFHDPELLPLAIVWRWRIDPRVKLVYDAHENVPKNLRSRQWIPKLLRKPFAGAFSMLELWAVRRCDLVVAATEGIASHVGRGTRACVIVRNYPLPLVEQPARVRNPGDARIRCIYSGGMMPTRGIRELLQVFRELEQARYELILLGPFFSTEFEREIRDSAPNNVRVLAPVPFPQVAAHLARSDIGMMTLLPTENHLDSLPIKLFEYMQLGLPVVGSNFPLWERLINDAGCGLTVDPNSVGAIRKAIVKLGDDVALREQMSHAAVEAARAKYAWQSQERALLDAYNATVAHDTAVQNKMRQKSSHT
jgi:glycosyltransferase involved in cell wall biosynthesis